MTVAELDKQLRDLMIKLMEIEDAARGIAAELRTQAMELQRIRLEAQRELQEKPKTQ